MRMTATASNPSLHLLTVHSDRYACTPNSRFYAFRGGDSPTWTLFAPNGEFQPKYLDSVEACDAALEVLLAVTR